MRGGGCDGSPDGIWSSLYYGSELSNRRYFRASAVWIEIKVIRLGGSLLFKTRHVTDLPSCPSLRRLAVQPKLSLSSLGTVSLSRLSRLANCSASFNLG